MFGLAGCGQGESDALAPPRGAGHRELLEWAVSGPWRVNAERDPFRHPLETLTFWGLRPGITVLEIFPGRGWLTSILAPYLAASGGRLIVAQPPTDPARTAQAEVTAEFTRRFADTARFGTIETVVLDGGETPLAAVDSLDLTICARNLHTLMAMGLAEAALSKIIAATKPRGLLGIEQHRGFSGGVQDPTAASGYVQEAFVKALAQAAGFSFVGSTDINANPRDTKDHPFGVWTLPPVLRSAPLGQPDDPNFDRAPYAAIGESDRMTLKFTKPAQAAERP